MTGIVLAGGRSRRFGRDKLIEPVEGVPLLHRAIRSLEPVCSEVIVSVAFDADPPPMPDDVGVVLVRDTLDDQGPLSGLASALQQTEDSIAVVVGGDMPELSARLLDTMIATLWMSADVEESSAEMVALETEGGPVPLPCVLAAQHAAPKIAAMVGSGERRLRALLTELRVVALPESSWRDLDPEGGSLRDIDRPEDLLT